MAKRKIGVIGGGIVGTALGYNLSLYDEFEVTLFEKDQVGSGTTAKSAGTVCLFDDSLSHEFWDVRLYGFQTYENLEKEEHGSAGFDKTGTLVVATDLEVEKFIKTGIALTKSAGYTGEYLTDKNEILKHLPDAGVALTFQIVELLDDSANDICAQFPRGCHPENGIVARNFAIKR